MAKKKDAAPEGNGASDETAAGAADGADTKEAKFGVLAQFIKDLSFESPNAPASLQEPGENPRLELNIQVQAMKHSDEVYEVDLLFETKAQSESGVIFNIELIYAAIFQAKNIPEEHMTRVLHVDAPIIMFPFMRRVVADLTRDGGFQPLMLDPIDFNGLFRQNADKAIIVDAKSSS
ncbi:MAG: protein-export chaperone SecB [Proteobacteria bacterium]|nr:protein-export chaperone SecB [Pseudomonadota bacterium]